VPAVRGVEVRRVEERKGRLISGREHDEIDLLRASVPESHLPADQRDEVRLRREVALPESEEYERVHDGVALEQLMVGAGKTVLVR
jgi:hypothetical protein